VKEENWFLGVNIPPLLANFKLKNTLDNPSICGGVVHFFLCSFALMHRFHSA
jgi:hypothetical protein